MSNELQLSLNEHQHSGGTAYCTHLSCDQSDNDDLFHLHDVHALTEPAIESRLNKAEQLCQAQGARFTPLRQNVYKLILQSDKPIGAYDLIQSLQANREQAEGHKAKLVAPPTIYRTIDFLLNLGFIHQLTSINAFVPCCHPRELHNAVFLMCKNCQRVQECSNLPVGDIVSYVNQEIGFRVEQSVMELKGICQRCLPNPKVSLEA